MNDAEADRVLNAFRTDNPSILYFGKILGKGAYGQVRDVKIKDTPKVLAAKLIRKDDDDKLGEIKFVDLLKNTNIIKINQVLEKQVNYKTYYLIIMEKAMLRDLGKLSEFYFKHNLLKLIDENSFGEQLGENLLRFYTKQIINSMKTLDDNYLVHFDIKPENLLITINLVIKLSDFGLLTKIKGENSIRIPGGTQGFLTREYYKKDKVSNEDAKKQDYFSLGSTLFYLKFGEHMLKYQRMDEPKFNAFRITHLLDKKIGFIKSRPLTEQNFIDFICKLIQYDPVDRPNFEEIYRDKWLNENFDIIRELFFFYGNDEEKFIMELQKSDYLIEKKKESKIVSKKFKFKKIKKEIKQEQK
jgi:serine/threonine protein kinase